MRAGEHSAVQFGESRILYSIRRSPRRRTVAITVDPAAGIILTAPTSTPASRLDDLVLKKAAWILSASRHRRATATPLPRREFVTGETFRYLGRQYRLRVRRAPRSQVRLVGGWLEVDTPDAEDQPERVRKAVVAWYRAHAAERLADRTSLWAARLRLPPPTVLIREQGRRWGSCDRGGVLRFNWRIVQAPLRLVDYVAAHEVVHLLHAGHSRAFWSELGRLLPDTEGRRRDLRELGSQLIW